MYFLKKLERYRLYFPGNLEKYHCNRKEVPRGEVVVCVLVREEKSFSEIEFLQVAPNSTAF